VPITPRKRGDRNGEVKRGVKNRNDKACKGSAAFKVRRRERRVKARRTRRRGQEKDEEAGRKSIAGAIISSAATMTDRRKSSREEERMLRDKVPPFLFFDLEVALFLG